MWRALLGVAWSDGNCGNEEIEYFAKVFDNLPRYFTLSDEQRRTLAADLEKPGNIDEWLSSINDPQVRDTFFCFAHDLVMLDGELYPNEEHVLQKIYGSVGSPYDREHLLVEIKKFIVQRKTENDEDRQDLHKYVRSVSPIFSALDRLLMYLGIDIIE